MRRSLLAVATTVLIAIGVVSAQRANVQSWGNSINGIAISVTAVQSVYELGKPMPVLVHIRNENEIPARYISDPVPFLNYRLALYRADGSAVPLTPEATSPSILRNEPIPGKDIQGTATVPPSKETTRRVSPMPPKRSANLNPGQTASPDTLLLNEWFNIEEDGVYTLVVVRRITAWERGFCISNAVKINITK